MRFWRSSPWPVSWSGCRVTRMVGERPRPPSTDPRSSTYGCRLRDLREGPRLRQVGVALPSPDQPSLGSQYPDRARRRPTPAGTRSASTCARRASRRGNRGSFCPFALAAGVAAGSLRLVAAATTRTKPRHHDDHHDLDDIGRGDHHHAPACGEPVSGSPCAGARRGRHHRRGADDSVTASDPVTAPDPVATADPPPPGVG